eukprot:scaffold429823_cov34-Prasinocladus_malaysianus.AAC.1
MPGTKRTNMPVVALRANLTMTYLALPTTADKSDKQKKLLQLEAGVKMDMLVYARSLFQTLSSNPLGKMSDFR